MSVRADVTRASLDRLLHIADDAGAAALAYYGAPCAVARKEDDSPVTQADHAAHQVIVDQLADWDCTIPIISEESPLPPYEQRANWPRFWLVDPLDGTKEFLAQNGEFTVNIALIENGEPVLAAIVAPALATAYSGGRGLGSWRSDARGHTIRLPAGEQRGGDALRIVESRSHPTPRLEAFIESLGPVQRIPLGSSLKFCAIAEGTADVYARFGPTMEWDVAAGDCIVRNARPDHGIVCRKYNQPALRVPEFIIGVPRACPRAATVGV
jgi:3'(2'), 5'-bisphosphate nucleotidase